MPTPAQAQLTALVREHAVRVRRVLARRGVAAADLPDAEQEVFIVAQRKLKEFEGRSSLATWLFGIAANVASQHRRRAHHRREQLGLCYEPASDAPDPLARLQAIESVLSVRKLLDALSPEQRDVIVLHELTELTMRQVARELDVPLKTAFSRLYAGHRALRRALRRAPAREPRRGRVASALGMLLTLKWLPRAQALTAPWPLAALAAVCVALGVPRQQLELVLVDATTERTAHERLMHRERLPEVFATAKPVPAPATQSAPHAARTTQATDVPSAPPSMPTDLVVFRTDGDSDALPYPHPFAERAFTSVDPRTLKPRLVMPAGQAFCPAHGPCAL